MRLYFALRKLKDLHLLFCSKLLNLCRTGSTFRWQTSDWSECSASCNGGLKFRQVYCAETSFDEKRFAIQFFEFIKIHFSFKFILSSVRIINDERCREDDDTIKPSAKERCNKHSCSGWIVGNWSLVRVFVRWCDCVSVSLEVVLPCLHFLYQIKAYFFFRFWVELTIAYVYLLLNIKEPYYVSFFLLDLRFCFASSAFVLHEC